MDKNPTQTESYFLYSQSPFRLLVIISFMMFTCEGIVMVGINFLPSFPIWLEAIIDSILLVVLVSPSLYFFLFRPLVIHINKCQRVEEELKESQKKLDAIFSSVQTGIIVIDAESRTIVDANPYAVSRIGISADKIAGKVCHEYICPAEEGKCPITDLSQTVHSSESVLLSMDGEKIPIFKSVTALNMNDKKYLLESFVDISELKKVEEEKKKLEAQLQRAQKLESVGILAGGIAHDFNNLLSIIMGNISMAKDDVKPELGISDFLSEVEKASSLARDLTKQLITFSKGGTPVKKPGSIGDLVKETTNFTLSDSNIKSEFFFPDDLWFVEFDQGQMKHSINNIILNAVESMPDGGTVDVRAENFNITTKRDLPLPEGKHVKISIRDQGIGIPEEHLSKIFDPYFSIKERGIQKGMGLGLATTYSIINRHDGYITVESEVGVGTTFTIYLPVAVKRIAYTEPAKMVESEKPAMPTGRILLMDDEKSIRKVTKHMLIGLGYDPGFAKNGIEVIELFKGAIDSGKPFDVVILDLTIKGGMGGVDTIQKLLEIDPQVKAIVSSGYSNDPVMTNFRAYAFIGALPKPYRKKDLSDALNKVNPSS